MVLVSRTLCFSFFPCQQYLTLTSLLPTIKTTYHPMNLPRVTFSYHLIPLNYQTTQILARAAH
ncbi:hypothetical protein NC653_003402 [Populus alba x Populus x berolinensis]|uniref:Uncharacterized protein n=1 Tax=Populus alba x Populus x berolinensis TaxID=444605 RepID=A0AAD6WJ35_9ROSI|nr:hypothetical protein NC653_003402 [Populus alba x Populus x berolinensis]